MANAGDPYIGSSICLISMFEVRYEGILYQLNVQDSTIGLKNVRSFGSEGRKKDGPQVPPSDKVYEYILFRGSDIKDLKVMSMPPANTEEQVPNDPAIIQQRSDESITSPPLASVGKDNLTASTQWNDTPALRNVEYPVALRSNHSPIQMGSDISSATPPAMYQVYMKASSPSSMQQQLPQSLEIRASVNLGSASSSEFRTPVSTTINQNFSPPFPPIQYPTPLNPPLSAPTEVSQPSYSVAYTANLPTMSTYPLSHQDLVVKEIPVQISPTEAYLSSDSASFSANALNMPSFPFPHQNSNTNEALKAVSDPIQFAPAQPYATATTIGPAVEPMLTPSPSLLRTDNSAHYGSQIHPSTQNLHASQKNMGASLPMPLNTTLQLPTHVTQSPLLPFPSATQKYTEEFDFEAMNEKFKKDEVWGYLGKVNKVDKADGEEVNTAGLGSEQNEGHGSATNPTPAYNKDDFFDSISCNSLGHGPRKVQNRYYEQTSQRIDTFGFQQRPNPDYGGYGAGRSENFRVRGYGYNGGGGFDGPNNRGRGFGYHGGRGRGGNNAFYC